MGLRAVEGHGVPARRELRWTAVCPETQQGHRENLRNWNELLAVPLLPMLAGAGHLLVNATPALGQVT
jgi:hypothetical protein